MNSRTLLARGLVCLLVTAAAAHAKERPPCIPVFVTSVGAQGGFTDPNKGTQDSMKNLTFSLGEKKSLCLVKSREKARIVLEVQGRDTTDSMAGALFGPGRDRVVRVKFIFGDFATEMSGSAMGGTLGSGGAWGRAADKVANQVETWVKENRAKLDATAPATPAPATDPIETNVLSPTPR